MEPKHALLLQENRRHLILNAVSDDERLSLYCEALLTDPSITMLHNLDVQDPFEVERIYVPLRLSQERQLRYDTPLHDEASTQSKEDDPDIWIEEERQRRGEVIYDLEKAIHSFHRCVITGDSGAGKTTLLRHLTVITAQRSITGKSSLLPIYFEQQSFVRSGLHDLLDFVSTTWEEAYGFPAQQTRFYLTKFLDEGKALLLLDVLDETVVGEGPESAEQSYEAISQAILTLAADYPKAAIVVTTRKGNYRQHKPLANFTTLELMDFRFEDVKQLVQNWYEAANELQAEEQRTDLIKRLDENQRLRVLVANPLVLTLMMLAYEDGWNLPERRADLYRMCIESLLRKQDAQLSARRQEFKPEQKHQLLKAIAWHFHCKRQRYFTEHDLLQIIAAFLVTIGLPAERKHDMLQEIESEQAILQKQATGWHGFLHLSFQEYLAAEYMNDYQKEAELLRYRADPWWEEVMLLYLGITPDASSFLKQVYLQNGSMREDIFCTNVLLAGRCLMARPIVRETDLPAQVIERLFELVMSAQHSLLRQEAIKVVCSIDDIETNRRLVRLLSDNRLHAFMHRSITGALGSLTEPSVAGDLVQLLSDEQLDVNLRRSMVNALGRLGERSVAADLVRLLADEQLDIELRKNIAEVVATLGEPAVADDLLQMLVDEQLDIELRKNIANALGILGEPTVAADLVLLLADERLNIELRKSIADALGTLGERSVVSDLVQLLVDDQQDVTVRRAIANALGLLGERLAAAKVMVQLLSDEQLEVNLRWSIANALGTLGERSVASRVMVQLLSDKRLGVFVRRNIADALGKLGERAVAANLVRLLSDKHLHPFVRRNIADALGTLGEPSVEDDLVQLLSDKRLEVVLRRSIADTLAVYTHDLSIITEMVKSLPDKEISDSVYRALWTISRRARVWIVPGDLAVQSSNITQVQATYEIVPWK